mgnify:CR=1 FL=1
MDMNALADVNGGPEIKPKMHFKGKVTKVGLAGAVIDIGIDQHAAIHVSQIQTTDSEPVKRVEDILTPGQEIDVWVRRIRDERIELTMFEPLELEWREIKKGMVVKGKVVRLEKFGAFVEIGAERPGLIHISEMAHGYVRTPSEVVQEGEEVEAQVIDVNRRKKQIKLSLKALQPEPIVEEKPQFEEPPRVETPKEKPVRKRKARQKSDGEYFDPSEIIDVIDDAESEEESDTALAIALREAMEKAKARRRRDDSDSKSKKETTQEQEDLLNRTLGQRSSNSSS